MGVCGSVGITHLHESVQDDAEWVLVSLCMTIVLVWTLAHTQALGGTERSVAQPRLQHSTGADNGMNHDDALCPVY